MRLATATPQRARQTEASIIHLEDDKLLLAWTDFYTGNWRDEAPARIVGKWSDDAGTTWSKPFLLQGNIGRRNVMSASLIKLRSGRILLSFHRKDHESRSCHLMVKSSEDGAQRWTDPIQITDGEYYWCGTNDRLIQLDTGRVVVPVGNATCMTSYYSDDEGENWRRSAIGITVQEGNNYAEPVVVERADGTVLMQIRNRSGFIRWATSSDGALNWEPWPLDDYTCPSTPYAPANLKHVPGSGDLLMVWNNTGGHRVPLTAGISADGGRSWHNLRNVEPFTQVPPIKTYAYPSICFQGSNVHITYWETLRLTETRTDEGLDNWLADDWLFHLKYRRLPLSWFYQADNHE